MKTPPSMSRKKVRQMKRCEEELARLTVVSGMVPEKIINEVNAWEMTNRAFVKRSEEARYKEKTPKGKQKIGVIIYTKLREDLSKKGIELTSEQCRNIVSSIKRYRVMDNQLRSIIHE